MTPTLFVNPRSGGGKAMEAGLVERARERGIDTVVIGPNVQLESLVEDAVARGAEALGMAGGDGSLAVVAAAALRHGLPFVCIPAGTRNHFALDLGIARDDPIGALDAFASGVERLVDVAEVNGRVFLNNVSIGVYGEAVSRRDYRGAKVRTLLETVLGPGGSARGVEIADDRGRPHRDPAVVLVSNNPYSLEPPRPPGTRATLDWGKLGIVVVDPPSLARAWIASSLEVSASTQVHAGIDGEAVTLEPPLLFAIRPRALRVLVP